MSDENKQEKPEQPEKPETGKEQIVYGTEWPSPLKVTNSRNPEKQYNRNNED